MEESAPKRFGKGLISGLVRKLATAMRGATELPRKHDPVAAKKVIEVYRQSVGLGYDPHAYAARRVVRIIPSTDGHREIIEKQ